MVPFSGASLSDLPFGPKLLLHVSCDWFWLKSLSIVRFCRNNMQILWTVVALKHGFAAVYFYGNLDSLDRPLSSQDCSWIQHVRLFSTDFAARFDSASLRMYSGRLREEIRTEFDLLQSGHRCKCEVTPVTSCNSVALCSCFTKSRKVSQFHFQLFETSSFIHLMHLIVLFFVCLMNLHDTINEKRLMNLHDTTNVKRNACAVLHLSSNCVCLWTERFLAQSFIYIREARPKPPQRYRRDFLAETDQPTNGQYILVPNSTLKQWPRQCTAHCRIKAKLRARQPLNGSTPNFSQKSKMWVREDERRQHCVMFAPLRIPSEKAQNWLEKMLFKCHIQTDSTVGSPHQWTRGGGSQPGGGSSTMTQTQLHKAACFIMCNFGEG